MPGTNSTCAPPEKPAGVNTKLKTNVRLKSMKAAGAKGFRLSLFKPGSMHLL